MEITLERIREAVIRSKNEVRIAGVESEHIEAIATALAIFDLMGLRSAGISENESAVSITKLPETFAEWARNYRLTTHFDRFLAVMVYLYERGTTSVSTADVLRMYNKARWKRPANAADTFAKGAERILFAESEDTSENESGLKRWRITQPGYNHFIGLRIEQERE